MTGGDHRTLLADDGLRAVEEWEREFGPFTDDELRAARERVADELV